MLVCIPTFALIFTNISLIAIPEGNVVQIKINDEIVWEEESGNKNSTFYFVEDGETNIVEEAIVDAMDTRYRENQTLVQLDLGKTVTSLKDYAFANCSNLTYATMSDFVTNAGNYSFYRCVLLTNIVLSTNLSKITRDMFRGCVTLPSINFPDSVSEIQNEAFAYCYEITNINIPSQLCSIGKSAFTTCTQLTGNIVFPNTLTNIDENAFFNCSALNQKIIIPESVQNLAYQSFSGTGITDVEILANLNKLNNQTFSQCSSLTNVVLPNSITNLGTSSFQSCISLKSINFPTNLKQINTRTFYRCIGLKSIELPVGIVKLETNAFERCSNITNIVIPNSLIDIGTNAFVSCGSVKSITVPEVVCQIGFENVFNNSTKITDITINSSNISSLPLTVFDFITMLENLSFSEMNKTEVKEIENFPWNLPDRLIIHCVNGDIPIYYSRFTFDDSGDTNVVKYLVMNEMDSRYENDSTLVKAELEPTFESIEDNAFSNCVNLEYVSIPNTITNIGVDAFSGCSNISDIDISKYVFEQGISSIFSNSYTGLKNITFNYDDISFETNTFDEFTSLMTIGIPRKSQAEVKALTNYPWNLPEGFVINCLDGILVVEYEFDHNLTKFYYSDGSTLLTNIVGEMSTDFKQDSTLIKVLIGSNVTSFADTGDTDKKGAFYQCENLSKVFIPGTIKTLGRWMFDSCTSLTSVELEEGVQDINRSAFCNCSNLQSITLPSTATNIGNWAFGRDGLLEIVIPDNVVSIGTSSFESCSSMASITVGTGLNSVATAFKSCSKLKTINYYRRENESVEDAESRLYTLFNNKGIPNYSSVTFTCLNPIEE